MTDIWLVRHGEAAAGWGEDSNPELSEPGEKQAVQASGVLHEVLPIGVRLLSSPLKRAQQTAKPLAQRLNASVVVDARYAEVPSPVPLDQRQTWLRQFMSQEWAQQSDNLCAWRHELIEGLLSCRQPTVIFTHFLVINTALGFCRGDNRVLQVWPANGSVHHFKVEQGRLSEVQLGEMMPTVVN